MSSGYFSQTTKVPPKSEKQKKAEHDERQDKATINMRLAILSEKYGIKGEAARMFITEHYEHLFSDLSVHSIHLSVFLEIKITDYSNRRSPGCLNDALEETKKMESNSSRWFFEHQFALQCAERLDKSDPSVKPLDHCVRGRCKGFRRQVAKALGRS